MAARRMTRGLGGAIRSFAGAAASGQAAEGAAGELGDQLSDLEMLEALLGEAAAAAHATSGVGWRLGEGLGLQGLLGEPGMGGEGQGAGGRAPRAPTPSGTRAAKADVETTAGDVIASQLFEGPQIRGESVAAVRDVVAAETRDTDEVSEDEVVPRMYHEVQKHYFGELDRLTEAIEDDETTTPGETGPGDEGEGENGADEGDDDTP